MAQKKPLKEERLFGIASLGERGQVVIPKEIRQKLDLKKGHSFMVILNNDAIVLIAKEKMEDFIKQLTTSLKK